MSRVIKFRAWDKKARRFQLSSRDQYRLFLDLKNGRLEVGNGDENFIWEQFTGLLDKNGKEIYRGDVVRNNDEIWDIYYAEGAWKMGLNGNRTDNDHLFLLEHEHSEIIGNIHENPDLLNRSPKPMICPRCKGEGEVREKGSWWLAPFTLGLSLMFTKKCPVCEGKAVIKNE